MRLLLVIGVAVFVAACGSPNSAQQERLNAAQSVVNERVKSGQMTESEGRLAIATMKAEIDAERRRNYAIMTGGSDGGATYQPVGGGTVIRY